MFCLTCKIEYCDDKEKVIEDENDEDGGWVDTHHYDNAGAPTVEEKVSINIYKNLGFYFL